jgi:hypothetical protein
MFKCCDHILSHGAEKGNIFRVSLFSLTSVSIIFLDIHDFKMEWNGTENNPFFYFFNNYQLFDELLVRPSLFSSNVSQSSSLVKRSLSLSASDGNDTR